MGPNQYHSRPYQWVTDYFPPAATHQAQVLIQISHWQESKDVPKDFNGQLVNTSLRHFPVPSAQESVMHIRDWLDFHIIEFLLDLAVFLLDLAVFWMNHHWLLLKLAPQIVLCLVNPCRCSRHRPFSGAFPRSWYEVLILQKETGITTGLHRSGDTAEGIIRFNEERIQWLFFDSSVLHPTGNYLCLRDPEVIGDVPLLTLACRKRKSTSEVNGNKCKARCS